MKENSKFKILRQRRTRPLAEKFWINFITVKNRIHKIFEKIMREMYDDLKSKDEVEIDKLQEKIDARRKDWNEYIEKEGQPERKEIVETISEGFEKITIVPMYSWGSKRPMIEDSFETDVYITRQKENGVEVIYVGHNKLEAKEKEKVGYSAQAQNADLGVNDRFEIGKSGKIVMHTRFPESWNPPAGWKVKDKIAGIKEKILKKPYRTVESSPHGDIPKRNRRNPE